MDRVQDGSTSPVIRRKATLEERILDLAQRLEQLPDFGALKSTAATGFPENPLAQVEGLASGLQARQGETWDVGDQLAARLLLKNLAEIVIALRGDVRTAHHELQHALGQVRQAIDRAAEVTATSAQNDTAIPPSPWNADPD